MKKQSPIIGLILILVAIAIATVVGIAYDAYNNRVSGALTEASPTPIPMGTFNPNAQIKHADLQPAVDPNTLPNNALDGE